MVRGSRRLRAAVLMSTMVALALVVTACGSSKSSGGGAGASSAKASSGSGGNAEVKWAQAYVAKYRTQVPVPPAIPPVSKPIPKGKSVTLVTCPFQGCQPFVTGASDAAKALGWSYRSIVNSGTPASAVEAWKNAIAQHPSAIFGMSSGIGYQVVSQQLAQGKKEGIVEGGTSAGPGVYPVGGSSAMVGTELGTAQTELVGKVLGAAIVDYAGSGPDTLIVSDKSNPAWNNSVTQVENIIKAAGGTTHFLQAPLQNLGTQDAQLIANYVRANPNIKYVAVIYDGYFTGLQAAMGAAGVLGKVKLFSGEALQTSLPLIKSGFITGDILQQSETASWDGIDQLARGIAGDRIAVPDLPGTVWLIEKQNIAEALKQNLYTFPYKNTADIRAAYVKAWTAS
jgi:ribose transport system substrate-binding protein